MTGINYTVGDATVPQGLGKKLIVHCCNDIGAWGAGFVLALSRRWPVVEAEYRRKSEWQRWRLGEIQLVNVEDKIAVVNLIGQHGVGPGIGGRSPVRYDAIFDGLTEIARHYGFYESVHMPRMGAGLAGGRWPIIEAIINETLIEAGFPVTVYDLP